MKRTYRGRDIELLAPVGTFADFKEVIHSAADAVYFGGKKFNMRMHNPQHNLSNEEILTASESAHSLGKKVYVTFNNMMTDQELADAEAYLRFLEQAKVDALIVQDFGSIQLIKNLDLDLELHLSVMANVHNQNMLAAAKNLGVSRCVVSREASLDQVHRFVAAYPELEYEYFIHGDMCIAHGAQCYSSGVFFGKSGNRGLCMKPCRWAYQQGKKEIYPMAVKDMSLYQHIPELILSGVNSYKIEGRMRGSDYLIELINLYGEAIDRFLADPLSYQLDTEKVAFLEKNRVRDLSTAYAFGQPGESNIALDGKREPRTFSHPIEEAQLKKRRLKKLLDSWPAGVKAKTTATKLRVTVDSYEAAKAALTCDIDCLYLSGEVLQPNRGFSREEIKSLVELAKEVGTEIFYTLPRMVNEEQFSLLDDQVQNLKAAGITGLLCSNLGEIQRYQSTELLLRGDYGLNVYNHLSGEFYQQQQLDSVTLSIEAPASIVANTPKRMSLTTELIVQGAPTLMYMEHSFKKANLLRTDEDWIDNNENNGNLELVDVKGFIRKIREDQYGKNHLLPTKDFSYISVLPEIISSNVQALRIEGKEYSPSVLKSVIQCYQKVMKIEVADLEERWQWAEELVAITGNQQSLQSLVYD